MYNIISALLLQMCIIIINSRDMFAILPQELHTALVSGKRPGKHISLAHHQALP